MIQPFNRIEGLSTTKFSAIFVSDQVDELVDRKRYETLVELDPWDKLVDCTCECNGFRFKKTCKHINQLLQTILEWGEINELPKKDE